MDADFHPPILLTALGVIGSVLIFIGRHRLRLSMGVSADGRFQHAMGGKPLLNRIRAAVR